LYFVKYSQYGNVPKKFVNRVIYEYTNNVCQCVVRWTPPRPPFFFLNLILIFM